MARIPQDELERLKREVDLVELVRSLGVELEQQGKELVGLCPLHEESTPSFRVNPAKGLFFCFGCGAKGSALDLVMLVEGVSLRHAAEILRQGWEGLEETGRQRRPPKRTILQKLPGVVEAEAGDGELRTQVADYYHETLKQSPEALEYLVRRGLDPDKLVDRFHLGYSNRTLGYHLPNGRLKGGKAIRERLAELGIIRATGHELLRGSLVVPIFDASGQVVQMYGRKIRDDLRADTPKHLYLPGPRRGVFNLAALRDFKEVILCEALVDALTFVSAGFPNVTAAYGKNGFTEEMLEALKAYGTTRVLIAYDRDAESEPAAQQLAQRLGGEGLSCFRVCFPRNLDANEYALKVTPATHSLGLLLRSAEHMSGPLLTLTAVPAPRVPAVPTTPLPEPEPAPPLAAFGPAAEVPATPPASPIPAPSRPEIPAEVSDNQVVIRLGDRYWRVRGLAKNLSLEQMRVNVFVGLADSADRFHQDTLDLYSAKQRQAFTRHAAVELGATEELVKKDLGAVFFKLEGLQEAAVRAQLEAKEATPVMTAEEREAALELLRAPALLDRVAADFERCGVVGERTNKLVTYLAAVSRKLAKPLAVMVQSSSAAGKSALMNAVLSLVPPEELVAYSAMTGQSLFYMGEADLKHKVLAIAEEEGAEKASYALKLLQSEGELTIASTGKDPASGRLVTHEYRVEGPTAILTTTTAVDLDEELLNRCIVLSVDESRQQTQAIHRAQREEETLEGYLGQLEREEVVKQHRNAQRLLRPLPVVNPFARQLTFLDGKTRTRRDHLKYLALIRAVALLHQHQRPLKSGEHRGKQRPYVEVTVADIAAANSLAAEVLGRTLDELPPQTRRFLLDLDVMVRETCTERGVDREDLRFTARQVRERTGWGATQVKVHLKRLVDMEYLLSHHASRGHGLVYELLYDGEGREGEPFMMGLIDVERLRKSGYDLERSASKSGRSESEPDRSGLGRPLVGPWSGGGRTAENGQEVNGDRHSEADESAEPENALTGSAKIVPPPGRSRIEESSPLSAEKEAVITEETDDEQAGEEAVAAVAGDGSRRP
jgi:DNA primase catalytic core